MQELSESSFGEDFFKESSCPIRGTTTHENGQDGLFSEETLPKDLSFDEFPDETLPKDLSFEFEDVSVGDLPFEDGFATETASDKSSTGGDPLLPTENIVTLSVSESQRSPSKESPVEAKPFREPLPQDDPETETDLELPDIGQEIKKSLRAAMRWCDEVANTPNDFITNLKSQIPFFVVIGIIILLLWTVRLFFG
jgi:hypothetical protein